MNSVQTGNKRRGNEIAATSRLAGMGNSEPGRPAAEGARARHYSLYGYSFAVKISASPGATHSRYQSTFDDTYGKNVEPEAVRTAAQPRLHSAAPRG